MATTAAGWDNKFSTTLSSGITASDTTIPLTNLPTASEGWLVIEPDSSTAWEEIYYTSKTGSGVVCPSVGAGRGQGGSTAASHSSGATVRCDTTAEMFEALQDGTALADAAITPNKLQGSTGTSWGWTSFTPTFTNFSLGNGALSCRYKQTGKTVNYTISVTFGSTTAMGTAPTFTLPVTAINSEKQPHGLVYIEDASPAGNVVGAVYRASTTTASLNILLVSGSLNGWSPFTASVPITWASGDVFTHSGRYEAA